MDLFPSEQQRTWREAIAPGAWVLRQFALADAPVLWQSLQALQQSAPLRTLYTPGGQPMSVRTSNCGTYGWISDRRGYRYTQRDPETGQAWPAMPTAFLQLAQAAAQAADYPDFHPDSGLINYYQIGTKMGLHQDKDEQELSAPIVSVSLGLSATFLFGGKQRRDKPQRIALSHGDIVVWGGETRLNFHGVTPIKAGEHPLTGACRVNLTFRQSHVKRTC